MYNNNYGYNPYYQQRYNMPQQSMPTGNENFVIQTANNSYKLQGKQVESLDVVKATDIPFDGSISYFPLTDNSAIVTKQLQNDGTSKITIFKPIEEQKEESKYITTDDMKKALKEIDLSPIDDIREELNDLKKEIRDLKKKKKED